ncbi:DUF4440 domain-containing protein [Rhizobium sp. 18055]|uniref:nuclear transport factor 2 family protein n=1 Tax=Rhizobium sp. 18055 TaxID=2681403 RepID=UPI0013575B55|nr:DUF4440 domain-containing protein [Rhizobium sp. 18055]
MDADALEQILNELKEREPIFHRRQFGTDCVALEQMTCEDFWEIGASGQIYTREFVIASLLERYNAPEPHEWPCRNFSIQCLAESLFLVSYTLSEPNRTTRRVTLWRRERGSWRIAFHQGTIVG